MALTRERMWDRMMASDAAYNGRFFTGVHSTGIYCLPSCHARKPKPENVRFYRSTEQAEAAGLRPCKKCRPDEFAKGTDSELEHLSTVVDAVRTDPARFAGVEDVAYFAAMSPSSLFAALRTHYQVTPGALLAASRVRKAAALLRTRSITAAEAGIAAGFDSTSAFYENFRRDIGMPPAQYQRLAAGSEFVIELPSDYRTEPVLALLARDPESRTEQVDGDRIALGLWAGEVPAVVEGRFEGSRVHFCFESVIDGFEVHRQVIRLLGLDQEPAPFVDHVRALGYERLVAGREGLRIPQSPTPFDGLVWSIVGQQVGIGFAAALRRRVNDLAGVRINETMSAPATPARVAALSVDDLLPHQFSRRKAEYLLGAAEAVVTGRLDLDGLAQAPAAQAERTLLGIRGIGPWSANYLMMRSLGFADCLPLGDTGLTSGLANCFDVPRPSAVETVALMAPFRPYRSLATFHLWRALGA